MLQARAEVFFLSGMHARVCASKIKCRCFIDRILYRVFDIVDV